MKIKPEFSVRFDEADICIVRRLPDGTEEPFSSRASRRINGIQKRAPERVPGLCRV